MRPPTSAHMIKLRDQSHALALAVRVFQSWVVRCLCVRAFSELSHLSKSSRIPFMQGLSDCGGMVSIRKVNCSCGHVFVAKHNKHLNS